MDRLDIRQGAYLALCVFLEFIDTLLFSGAGLSVWLLFSQIDCDLLIQDFILESIVVLDYSWDQAKHQNYKGENKTHQNDDPDCWWFPFRNRLIYSLTHASVSAHFYGPLLPTIFHLLAIETDRIIDAFVQHDHSELRDQVSLLIEPPMESYEF